MNKVIISDVRPGWMRREDEGVACMTRCRLYRHCISKMGFDCKKLGGDNIPVLKERKNGGA
ncbi:hypothetical protein [Sporosarcina sp. FSL K6-1508]|uniref:hypothetical protein n=1 Tax=Sporosarcina sp. FSL K6-1508 TaxID=2921553 RepID=UPI0030FC5184